MSNYFEFKLTDGQQKTFIEWDNQHRKECANYYCGAIGGRLTFEFTPTGIGPITTVKCVCGERLEFDLDG